MSFTSRINNSNCSEAKIEISAVVVDSLLTKVNRLQQAFQLFFDERNEKYQEFSQTSSFKMLGRIQIWEAEKLGELYSKVVLILESLALLKKAGYSQEWESIRNAIDKASSCSLTTSRSYSRWFSCLESMRKIDNEFENKADLS